MDRLPEIELRRELVKFGKWLYRLGFMPGTSGNLSVRLDWQRLLVTPTGTSKYLLTTDDAVSPAQKRSPAKSECISRSIASELTLKP